MVAYWSGMRLPDLEIDLLRAFVTVAETGGFTSAGDVLGRTQSAVSQQIRRLEGIVGQGLLVRTSRAVRLTPDGEALLAHAHRIIGLNDEIMRRMKAPPITGALRLGVSEDFVPHQLPRILRRFGQAHPGVRLELMTGLSTGLVAALGEGRLDLVIAKRDAQPQSGRVIWRERLIWIASEDQTPDLAGPLPLVALPPPCSYRRVMLDVLKGAGLAWTVTCTTRSIIGLQAAVAGGLGVSILGRSFMRDGLRELPPDLGLPPLPDTEVALFGEEGARLELAGCLVDFLMDSLEVMGAAEGRIAGRRGDGAV